VQSVPITNKFVNSNPIHGEAVDVWISPGTPVSSINITDRHDVTEILLKVTFKTITQSLICMTENAIYGSKYDPIYIAKIEHSVH
jgi:hypothetical protein